MTTQIENMTCFTAIEYLMIDIANSFGHDKMEFEDRIKWVKDNINNLEQLADHPDCDKKTRPLYIKAVMAFRKACQGLPIGHVVHLDAACSGLQLMSVMTGCVSGATATGLVNPNKRADAYKIITDSMNKQEGISIKIPRQKAKEAVMTSFYGSRAKPKEIFGEDTPELNAFYKAMGLEAPGAWTLLDDLMNAWNPYALEHAWKLPDGYDARVKVMQKLEKRIEVDELNHATFTYEFFVNQGSKTGISLAANVTHSVDAYVLRCMQRRCNYDMEEVSNALFLLGTEMTNRMNGQVGNKENSKMDYFLEQYNRSKLVDVVILPYISSANVGKLPTELISKLLDIISQMLKHKPFAVITVHDSFGSHPNYSNFVRSHYREILADIADSNLLDDLLSQLYGVKGTFPKLSAGLGDIIRKSNYGLS